MSPSDLFWPEDPLPVPSVPIVQEVTTPPRKQKPYVPKPRKAPRILIRSTGRRLQAEALLRVFSSRKCRCTGRIRRCDACKAMRFLEQLRKETAR